MSKPSPSPGEGSLRTIDFGPHLNPIGFNGRCPHGHAAGDVFSSGPDDVIGGRGVRDLHRRRVTTSLDEKKALRAQLLTLRRARANRDTEAVSSQLQARILASPHYAKARTVALYSALPGEVSTALLFRQGREDGKVLCFPRCVLSGLLLTFHRVDSADQLAPGTLGILEPRVDRPEVPLEEIDLFVIPGMGFSRAGHRLGHGKGYYDATLCRARPDALKVGAAFAEQLVAGPFPVDSWDVSMDLVATEAELIRCANEGGQRP